MQTQKQPLPFEEAAVQMSVTGWVCKTCGRFYGNEERLARYCCAPDLPCETKGCTGRSRKGWICCDECRKKKDLERWKAYPEVDWDGETPLCVFDDDTYFFDSDDLDQYLYDSNLKIEDVRLVICVPDQKPRIDVMDRLSDYLSEDTADSVDTTEIDKTISDWLENNVPVVWIPGKTRPSVKSMQDSLVSEEPK